MSGLGVVGGRGGIVVVGGVSEPESLKVGDVGTHIPATFSFVCVICWLTNVKKKREKKS